VNASPNGTAPSRSSCVPIGDVRYRQAVRVEGRVRSVRVQPRAEVPTLECVLVDDTGALSVVFLGRRSIAGIDVGARLRVEGTAGESRGRLALLNPIYELIGPQNGTMGHG
jgi:RecG-like helicase